ncbi:GMC family oxidoreductase N-terminal domain-containing protein [Achromobacter sp. F4_2707]|uniref:GMC family oxidoreductase n=1 Tax=Achromobacter sp. F4_2707 TaxID=3114286 RepID=UPI0039C629ED
MSKQSGDKQHYDYVIVGGGAAGCILADRLTASGRHKVLLLEAGGEGRHPWISIPAGFSKLMTNKTFNWGFETEPEENTLDRRIAVPRGKGLGGSTLINGMIYVRGIAQDYDGWAEQGATGWAWGDVEPYFRKLENWAGPQQTPGRGTRGKSGPMHVCEVSERFPISEAFIEAATQTGLPRNPDYNGGDQEGVGYYQVLQKGGRRWSVVNGYLERARQRGNFTVQLGAHVQRINLTGKRCTGVSYRLPDGSQRTVHARAEVVLAAGAIQTPQLLELSGIGRPSVLQAAGIPVIHALDGVGENYIDHFCTRMNWRVKGTRTLNELSRGVSLIKAVAQYGLTRKGILSLGTGLAFGFLKSHPELALADVQLFFVHASYANAADRRLDVEPGMTIGVAQLRPKSQGSIHIRGNTAEAGLSIRPNFLAEQEDRDSLVGGMMAVRKIVEQPALAKYVAYEMSPGSSVQTPEQWLEFARQNGQTIYHPIGTCRMGNDSKAVVSPDLKLKELEGLRIVDASVMPSMVSGNTQAAVMMVAEKGADLILQDAA